MAERPFERLFQLNASRKLTRSRRQPLVPYSTPAPPKRAEVECGGITGACRGVRLGCVTKSWPGGRREPGHVQRLAELKTQELYDLPT
jgi:hypothetical protein